MSPKLSALAVLMAATTFAAAEVRTWHLKSGATMEAELIAFPSPETVEVKRSDGKMYTLSADYLADADQAYLSAERAKQWKEVSVDKLLGTKSAGRYKECSVSGKGVGGKILVAKLPAPAEAVLLNRQQQEAQIDDLNSQIQTDIGIAKDAHAAAATRSNRADRNANKAKAKLATQDEAAVKTSLVKLKADYAEYVKKTKPATTLLMRNTGLVYEHLPVWECQTSPKRP